VSWITWTHIHFVTIGAFTQLLFGTLPQLAARKLERPGPSPSTFGVASVGLNVALVLVWYGRAFGEPLWFDIGLGTIWLLTSWLFAVVLVMVRRSDGGRARDPTIGFYLLSPFVYLIGLALAFGLYSHGWDVPGGWYGLREAHVHANAWGFLGLAAIGTLYDLFPRLVDAELYSERLKRYSLPLFALGIVPLVVGPVLGMGKTVTAIGLVLYAAGYVLYIYTLARTYWAGTPNGTALSVLVAQLWILGPASFAPFILFGVPLGIPDPWIETGALHFFFLGWALPIALAGLLLVARSLEWSPGTARGDGSDSRVDGLVPRSVSRRPSDRSPSSPGTSRSSSSGSASSIRTSRGRRYCTARDSPSSSDSGATICSKSSSNGGRCGHVRRRPECDSELGRHECRVHHYRLDGCSSLRTVGGPRQSDCSPGDRRSSTEFGCGWRARFRCIPIPYNIRLRPTKMGEGSIDSIACEALSRFAGRTSQPPGGMRSRSRESRCGLRGSTSLSVECDPRSRRWRKSICRNSWPSASDYSSH